MDVLGGLKSEILRPALVLLIPGLVAGLPFLFVLSHYHPSVFTFADEHPTLSTFLSLAASAVFGMVASELGTNIETGWIDKALGRKDHTFEDEWYKYLRVVMPEKVVAQSYIHDRVMYLHFELGMAAALALSLIGTTWAWSVRNDFAHGWFVTAIVVTLTSMALSLWEAKSTAGVLAKVRKELLKGVVRLP